MRSLSVRSRQPASEVVAALSALWPGLGFALFHDNEEYARGAPERAALAADEALGAADDRSVVVTGSMTRVDLSAAFQRAFSVAVWVMRRTGASQDGPLYDQGALDAAAPTFDAVLAAPGPIPRAAWLEQVEAGRSRYTVHGDVARFHDPDTGVSFTIVLAPGGDARALSVHVPLLRPHVFGIQAELEARRLAEKLGLGAVPASGASPVPFAREDFVCGYAASNAPAHRALDAARTAVALPAATLERAFRWNLQRAALHQALSASGHEIFVPRVVMVKHPETGGAASAVMWARFAPILLPYADLVLIRTDEMAQSAWVPLGAVRAALETLGVRSAAHVYAGRSEPTGMDHVEILRPTDVLKAAVLAASHRGGEAPAMLATEAVLTLEIARAGTPAAPAEDLETAAARWDALKRAFNACLRMGDLDGAVGAASLARQHFAGSSSKTVRAYARAALYSTAQECRRAGRLAKADEAARDLVTLAEADDDPILARAYYEVGLVALERDAPADAVEPFRRASERMAKDEGPAAASTVIATVNLGLALLRCDRFAEAVEVLERIVRDARGTASDGELDACFFNLALARVRMGKARDALPDLEEALTRRARTVGEAHPDWVEVANLKARALTELGRVDESGALLRRCASIVLGGGGEAHPCFVEALVVEAERAAAAGEGLRADALGRRALWLDAEAGRAGDPPSRERIARIAELRASWREDEAPEALIGPRRLAALTVGHTLRSYRAAQLDYVAAEPRPKRWFVHVPAVWLAPSGAKHLERAVRLMFAQANDRLGAAEPADPGYLDVVDVQARPIEAAELDTTDWDAPFRACGWEPSGAYSGTAAGLAPITVAELTAVVRSVREPAPPTPSPAVFVLPAPPRPAEFTARQVKWLVDVCGVVSNPSNPFGRSRLRLYPRRAVLDNLRGTSARRRFTCDVRPHLLESIVGHLQRGAFPVPPTEVMSPGSLRTIALLRVEGEIWTSLSLHTRAPGYGDALAALDALAFHLSNGQLASLPRVELAELGAAHEIDLAARARPERPRLDDDAEAVLERARGLARESEHEEVLPAHLLVAIAHFAHRYVFDRAGHDALAIGHAAEGVLPPCGEDDVDTKPGPGEELDAVEEAACALAAAEQAPETTLRHVVLALLDAPSLGAALEPFAMSRASFRVDD